MSENTLERLSVEFSDPGTLAYHIARYEWAKQFVRGKKVLDAGCGFGYGSAILVKVAHNVTGVDIEESAIEDAKRKYNHKNLNFLVMDCTNLTFPDESFECVISFEVFEHIFYGYSYINELYRVLKPNGFLLISTPNSRTWKLLGELADNPYHINMVTPEQFRNILFNYFQQVSMYGMRKNGSYLYSLVRSFDIFNLRLRLPFSEFTRKLATRMGGVDEGKLSSKDIIISKTQIRQCHTILAKCKKPEIKVK